MEITKRKKGKEEKKEKEEKESWKANTDQIDHRDKVLTIHKIE